MPDAPVEFPPQEQSAKSNTAKQYVQKWMPIVAASQSVKGNDKERELLSY